MPRPPLGRKCNVDEGFCCGGVGTFTRDRLRASRGVKSLATGQQFFEGFEALHALRRGHAGLAQLRPGHDDRHATVHERVRAVERAVTALGARLTKAACQAV